MDAQQQELAAFESSIAEAAGAEPTTTAAVAVAVESQPTEASGESVEHEAAEQSAGKESGKATPIKRRSQRQRTKTRYCSMDSSEANSGACLATRLT